MMSAEVGCETLPHQGCGRMDLKGVVLGSLEASETPKKRLRQPAPSLWQPDQSLGQPA